MKKILTLTLGLWCLLATYAQAPQKMNYQAIVRNASGQTVANGTLVSLRFTIHNGSANGPVVYTETQTATANQFGLVTVEIGTNASLAAVNWGNGDKHLQVEADPAGGSNYTIMGTSQLLSVPFALYAANSAPGPQGAQGVTGPQGVQGVPGAAGAQGPAGATGLQGVQGITGATGNTGALGPQGAQGITGPTGDAGAQGPQGVQGNTGLQGNAGPQGIQGAQGVTGPTGDVGAQGPQGVQGNTGLQGNAGPQGIQGAQGVTGPTGDAGAQGPQGVQGNTGLQGNAGPQGLQGAQGVTGPTGDAGAQGNIGPIGPQGPQGAQGIQGLQGIQGPIGPQGIQGDPGPQGGIGSVGPQGPQGPPGPQGAQGPAGTLGAGTAVGNTTFWDGSTWVLNNNNIFNAGGNVGIGTPSPGLKLHVVGDIYATNTLRSDGLSFLFNKGSADGTWNAVMRNDGGNVYIYPWGTGNANSTVLFGGGATVHLRVVGNEQVDGNLQVNGAITNRVWSGTLANATNFAQAEVSLVTVQINSHGGNVVAMGKMVNSTIGNACNRTFFRLYRDGVMLDEWSVWESTNGAIHESSMVMQTEQLAAGTYNYEIRAAGETCTRTAAAGSTKLIIYEF